MDLHQLTRQAFDAVNAGFASGDWDPVRRTLAPGFVYEETGTGLRIEGAAALVAALEGWRAALPDVGAELVRVVAAGDTSAAEVVWRGTHSGPLDTGAGVLPPSGRHIETWATVWMRWSDGVRVRERHHRDVLTLLTQVGALPAPVTD